MSTPFKLGRVGAALLVVLAGGAVLGGPVACPRRPVPPLTPSPRRPHPDAHLRDLGERQAGGGDLHREPAPRQPDDVDGHRPGRVDRLRLMGRDHRCARRRPRRFDRERRTIGVPADSALRRDTAGRVGRRAHRGRPGSRRLDRLGAGRHDSAGTPGRRIDVEAAGRRDLRNGDDYMVLANGPATGARQGPSNRFDLWVLDVEGSPLVVMRNSFPDTPAELMSQADSPRLDRHHALTGAQRRGDLALEVPAPCLVDPDRIEQRRDAVARLARWIVQVGCRLGNGGSRRRLNPVAASDPNMVGPAPR